MIKSGFEFLKTNDLSTIPIAVSNTEKERTHILKTQDIEIKPKEPEFEGTVFPEYQIESEISFFKWILGFFNRNTIAASFFFLALIGALVFNHFNVYLKSLLYTFISACSVSGVVVVLIEYFKYLFRKNLKFTYIAASSDFDTYNKRVCRGLENIKSSTSLTEEFNKQRVAELQKDVILLRNLNTDTNEKFVDSLGKLKARVNSLQSELYLELVNCDRLLQLDFSKQLAGLDKLFVKTVNWKKSEEKIINLSAEVQELRNSNFDAKIEESRILLENQIDKSSQSLSIQLDEKITKEKVYLESQIESLTQNLQSLKLTSVQKIDAVGKDLIVRINDAKHQAINLLEARHENSEIRAKYIEDQLDGISKNNEDIKIINKIISKELDTVKLKLNDLSKVRELLESEDHILRVQIESLEKRLESVLKAKQILETKIEGISQVKNTLETKYNNADLQIKAIESKYSSTGLQIEAIESKYNSTGFQIEAIESKLESISKLDKQMEKVSNFSSEFEKRFNLLSGSNSVRSQVHQRFLSTSEVDRLFDYWVPLFDLEISKRAISYLAHSICKIEDSLDGRLATTISAAVLRVLALSSLRRKKLSVLEIGTLFGISSCILKALGRLDQYDVHITVIDPLTGYYKRGSLDPQTGVPINRNTLERNFKKMNFDDSKVRIIEEFSQKSEAVRAAKRRKYDYIILDGDHSYEGLAKDYELYCDMLRPKGLLVFDDYDTPEWPDIKKVVDDKVKGDEKWEWLGGEWRTGIFRRTR